LGNGEAEKVTLGNLPDHLGHVRDGNNTKGEMESFFRAFNKGVTYSYL
jgi:hypothetical protein